MVQPQEETYFADFIKSLTKDPDERAIIDLIISGAKEDEIISALLESRKKK